MRIRRSVSVWVVTVSEISCGGGGSDDNLSVMQTKPPSVAYRFNHVHNAQGPVDILYAGDLLVILLS